MDPTHVNVHSEAVWLCIQAFTRLDTVTGVAQHYYPGPRCFCEELVFAPGPDAQTIEDDGYLMGMVFDASKGCSCLVVNLLLLDSAHHSSFCNSHHPACDPKHCCGVFWHLL